MKLFCLLGILIVTNLNLTILAVKPWAAKNNWCDTRSRKQQGGRFVVSSPKKIAKAAQRRYERNPEDQSDPCGRCLSSCGEALKNCCAVTTALAICIAPAAIWCYLKSQQFTKTN